MSTYRSSKPNHLYQFSFRPNRNFLGLFQLFSALPGAPWIHVKEVERYPCMICVQIFAGLDSFLQATFIVLAALLRYTNFENQSTASMLFLKPQPFVFFRSFLFFHPAEHFFYFSRILLMLSKIICLVSKNIGPAVFCGLFD